MRRLTGIFWAVLVFGLLVPAISCSSPPPPTAPPPDEPAVATPVASVSQSASAHQFGGPDLPPGQPGLRVPEGALQPVLKVEPVNSSYRAAPGGTSGFFKTGQSADITLSAIDFNKTGGPLLFNHQAGIATDGTHLLLADRNNNRVLIWSQLPTSNTPPDLVLGQLDFTSNTPGGGLNQMNWPTSVSTDGQRVVVADTFNDRILVWNSFPTASGTPANFAIQGARQDDLMGGASVMELAPEPLSERKKHFVWPWGVWTDGKKLVVSSTQTSAVLIWNSFPTRGDQTADVILTGRGKMATPRTVTSNGECLIVGDYNAGGGGGGPGDPMGGNFVWTSFPTRDEQSPDYFLIDPVRQISGWMQGTFSSDGTLALLGDTGLHLWSGLPQGAAEKPTLSVTGFDFDGGDGSSIAAANGRLYISATNGNKVLVYNSLPTRPDQRPDFAIGSPDVNTNTLDTNFIISNPLPASDGKSLFVVSDFDRKMYVWKQLPDQSGAKPDYVYTLSSGPSDVALKGNTLAVVGMNGVMIWKKPPLDGEMPDLALVDSIGSARLRRASGVAIDDRYFYIADNEIGKIYVWEGIPDRDSNPRYTLDVGQGVGRLSSDGSYLVATVAGPGGLDRAVLAYRVTEIPTGAQPVTIGGRKLFDLAPNQIVVSQGHLFVPQTHLNRVLVWNKIEDAIAGKAPDVLLGKSEANDVRPRITQDQLFWPSAVCFDGSYLWVGEFKFSERLLRFSPSP